MKHKLVPVAAALLTALASHNVAAESATDIVTDGWTVNGYASMNYRLVEGETTDNEYGKPDYMTAGTHGHSTNQVEFIIKKHTEHRTAYGLTSLFALSTVMATHSLIHRLVARNKIILTANLKLKKPMLKLVVFLS